MKKILIGFAACACLFTSCQKSDIAENIEQNNRSISFNLAMGNQTRASELITDDLKETGKPIDLWAYNNPIKTNPAPYFKETLEYNRTNSSLGWSTEYQRFMPTSGTLDYYAIYPTGGAINWQNPTTGSLAKFDYSVTGDGDETDLVAAAICDQATQTPVIPLRHILSQVNFGVYGYKGVQINVSNFQIHNVNQSGTFTFADNSVGSWSNQNTPADYTNYKMYGAAIPLQQSDVMNVNTGDVYIFGDGGNSAVGTSTGIFYNTAPNRWDAASNTDRAKLSNSFMLLPQTLATGVDNAYFTFDYTVTDKDGNNVLEPATGTVDLSVNGLINWEPNKRYVYMIDFKDILDGKALDFSASVLVEGWENYNKDDYNQKDDGIVDLSPFWRLDHAILDGEDMKTITYFTSIPGDPTPNGTILDVTANENNEITIIEGNNTSSFSGTTLNLTAPVIPDANGYLITAIGENAFKGCKTVVSITLPETVNLIGDSGFTNCTALQFVNIPKAVKSIGDWTFQYCYSLQSIEIPEGVKRIGDCTFNDCTSLATVSLPSTLESIGDLVFQYCSSLKTITIPDKVTTIGQLAFDGCKSLISVVLPASLTSLGNRAFLNCSALQKVNIPERMSVIEEYTFASCSSLTAVSIPLGVTTINEGAFAWCSALATAEINSSGVLSNIGDKAFASCDKLTSIVIPSRVRNIGYQAFTGCQNLASIYCYVSNQGNISISNNAFDYKSVTRTLYVPTGCIDNFYRGTWNANTIVEITALFTNK